MSQEYDNLLQDVMVNCPSSVPTTIDPELAVILRDFLQQTSAWHLLYQIPVDTTHTCYVLQAPQGTAINLLHNLYDSTDPDKKPVFFGGVAMDVPGQLQLKHPATAEATWIADVSLYPVRNITGAACKALVPGWILDRYYDTLLHGVLSRLMRQPLKAYTNIQLGQLHGASYASGRALAQANLARSNVWGTQQWVFPAATTARSRQVAP